MGQTTIIEEHTDHFNGETGEIISQTIRQVNKNKLEYTDEFIKVSKYLHVIFAYHRIPLNLVGISLLISQQMDFKTNEIALLKGKKQLLADMLGISLDRVNKQIQQLVKYNILKRKDRGLYEVNSFLYSTGSIAETRDLQAHFYFDSNTIQTKAHQKNLITGESITKAVTNYKNQVPGQLSLDDLQGAKE